MSHELERRKSCYVAKLVQNEEEKLKPENWKPITLTNTMYRITSRIISRWFQDIHKERKDDEKMRL
jgi:hypothetical protein